MRTPNEQLDGLDSDLAAAGQMIESLRQQLAIAENENIRLRNLQIIERIDSQKREVMLRDAIMEGLNTYKVPMTARIVEALAATEADLGGLILCEKEPVAEVDIADGFYWADICEDQIVKVGERLYRAKEQVK